MEFEQKEIINDGQGKNKISEINRLFKVSSLDSLEYQNLLETFSNNSLNFYDHDDSLKSIGVIRINFKQEIVFINDTACELFGYQLNELIGLSLDILLPAEEKKAHAEHIDKFSDTSLKVKGMAKHRIVKGRHKNGTQFPIDIKIGKGYQDGEFIYTALLRTPPSLNMQFSTNENNITMEKLFQASQIINGSHDNISELYAKISSASVKYFGLDFAWLGILENGKEPGIKPVSWAGNGTEIHNIYSNQNEILEIDHIKTTLKNGGPTIIYDLSLTANDVKWRREAISLGYQSMVVFALYSGNKIIGVMNFFSTYTSFSDEKVKILQFFVNQAAHAIAIYSNLQSVNSSISQLHESILEGWVKVLDLRDPATELHTQRVTKLAIKLAKLIGIPKKEIVSIKWGALVHDIGKIGIPDKILNKPGKFTAEDRKIMSRHPQYAYDLISKFPFLSSAIDIPYCHHEKWDGSGYPRGLKGKEIPLTARIFSVVDVFDALTSDRPYRKAWEIDKTINYIKEQSGLSFDPKIVTTFVEMLKDEILTTELGLPKIT